MSPKKIMAKVVEKKNLVGNYWSVWIESEEQLEYEAGQYVSIKVNEEGERRSYSLASHAGEEKMQLVADVTPMGKGSKFVLGLEVGDMVEVLVPMGEFVVKEDQLVEDTKGLLFVGTGSGIVPLRAMVHDLLEVKKETRPVRLHWGMRYEKDLFWVEEFRELEGKYENFSLDIVLSKGTDEWMGCKGHVNDCLLGHDLSFAGQEAYLCGSREMIGEVSELLEKEGVEKEKVHNEKFY